MYRSLRETPSSRHGILRRGILAILPVSMLLVLAACGGGGGGGDDGGGGDPPPAPGTNEPPEVNAGTDTSTTLPDATVSLSGSATDDGPTSALTYAWTSSDADATTFSASDAAATDATFSAAGSYTLTLTVSDGAQSASDTLVVTVNPAGSSAAVWPADDDDTDLEFHGWAKVEASTVGMDQGGLDDATEVATTVPTGVNPGSGMIVRHGQLVHSWGDIDQRLEVKSVTKSMGGIALGLALDANKVALSGKGVDYMPTFGTPPTTNATQAQAITLAQLATHTSGFEKNDNQANGETTSAIIFTPGTTWSYSDAGLNWLADVLTTVYQEDLSTVAQREVWAKLGLNKGGTNSDDVAWRTNLQRPATRAGSTLQYRELASGISANANAMARVGLLFLRNGMWKDQQVLSPDFIEQVKTPLPENASLPVEPDRPGHLFPNAQTDYGVLWWTNKSHTMPNVPTDAFWAWGLGEELIVVIPSLDLVIVRNGGQSTTITTGRTWNDGDWDGDVRVLEPFLNPIVAATTP
jgi:CubicO group peptidase (beta-lactamase class C family)